MKAIVLLAGLIGLHTLTAKGAPGTMTTTPPSTGSTTSTLEIATFAAGCFWCTEAVFEQTPGVKSVRSGYTGGTVANPTYAAVCTGRTGHAEATEITYDPSVVAYTALLDLFWRMHDPTSLNRQGADEGTQYRSAIFYHGEKQKQEAEASKAKLQSSGDYARKIVTEISPAGPFYVAEVEHQDYYRLNRRQPYCRIVIEPKLKKLGMKP